MASSEKSGESDFNLREFNNAKSSLIKYYSDIQISLGARFLGFSVAIFALMQVVNWNKQGLGEVFQFSITKGAVTFDLRLIPFFVAVLILMVYSVRSIFRYASVSGICNYLIGVDLSNIDKLVVVHLDICKKLFLNMIGDKVKIFFKVPFQWFVMGYICDEEKENRERNNSNNLYGWMISVVISLFALLTLLWILW